MAAAHAKSSISSVLRRNWGMWTVYFSCNNSCCDVVHELSSVWRLCIFSKFCKGVNRLSILNIFIDYNWWFAQHHLGTRGFFSRATGRFVSSATGRHVFGRRPKAEDTSGEAARKNLWRRAPWFTVDLDLVSNLSIKAAVARLFTKLIGHLHDGVILLLQPESFRVLLSCAN